MPDDKSKVGKPDRSKVAAEEDYELRHLAEKHGMSIADARKLIERFGNDRKLLAIAESLKHGLQT